MTTSNELSCHMPIPDLNKHIEENRDGQILTTPVGWVMFWRPDSYSIYIDDISVYPEFRNQGFILDLASVVENIAIAEGRHILYTNIHPSVAGAPRMHDIVIEYGFEPYIISPIINVYKKVID